MKYTWNRQIIRKTTNVFVKVADWNQNGKQGRGEIRASYGGEFKRLNQLLLARVERIDSQFAEYNEKHPNQIPVDVVSGFLADKPLSRRNQGKDSIGRLLGASYVSVLNWVRKYGRGLVGIRNFRPCKVMELDEMHSCVGLKNSRWIWFGIDRDANRNTLMWLSGTEVPERDKALVKEQRPSHGYRGG